MLGLARDPNALNWLEDQTRYYAVEGMAYFDTLLRSMKQFRSPLPVVFRLEVCC